jgi:hypothetical protein
VANWVGLGMAKELPEESLLVTGRVLRLLRARILGVPGLETDGVWGTEGGTAGLCEE